MHEAFFPSGAEDLVVEPATDADGAAIVEIGGADVVARWWELLPGTFRVVRDSAGSVQGFACTAVLDEVPARLYEQDPVAAGWREHVRAAQLPRGQRVLFSRFTMARGGGRSGWGPPARAALALDVKRTYLELRPELRRTYVYTPDVDYFLPGVEPLGFVALTRVSAMLDFGPACVDGWLSDVVGRELQAEDDPLAARRDEFTRLEWDVLSYLRERAGQAVAREDLLRDVWGYEWTGGSNVVEVAISALRRKLGDDAAAQETVRGVGYRFSG